MRSFTRNGGAYLNVDLSELDSTISFLRGVLTKEQFEKLMHRTFKEVGQRSKTPISKAVTEQYVVGKQWVGSQIGRYQLETKGRMGVTCVIPLKGEKGSIGGRFSASGGYKRKPVRTKLLRGKTSTLPNVMANQGGNPPFINPKSKVLGKVAYTRKTAARFPIARVVGLGVPQMPLNMASQKTVDALFDLTVKRLEHNLSYMLGTGFK